MVQLHTLNLNKVSPWSYTAVLYIIINIIITTRIRLEDFQDGVMSLACFLQNIYYTCT